MIHSILVLSNCPHTIFWFPLQPTPSSWACPSPVKAYHLSEHSAHMVENIRYDEQDQQQWHTASHRYWGGLDSGSESLSNDSAQRIYGKGAEGSSVAMAVRVT